jgi:hypothetical protein
MQSNRNPNLKKEDDDIFCRILKMGASIVYFHGGVYSNAALAYLFA